MPIPHVTLDTTFKQFVEEARGLRLAKIKYGTALYRGLVREFNRFKQAFLDAEQRETRQQARMLPAEDSLEAVMFVRYSLLMGPWHPQTDLVICVLGLM